MAMQTTMDRAEGRVPITIMGLTGELDASNFQQLIDDVSRLYDEGVRHLLIDLTDLSFMASSGLVALHGVLRVMHGEAPPDPEAGWEAFHAIGRAVQDGSTQSEVQLCGAQPAIAQVLQRTGLDQLFPSHVDRATAIAAF